MAVGSTGVWKFLSFINALLVAAYFGVTQETDVYFYLIILVGIFITLIQTVNTTAIIPQAMFLEQKKEGKGREVLNFFLIVYGAGTLLILLGGLFFPAELLAGCSRFTVEQLTAHTLLIRLSFVLFAFQLFSLYLTSILEIYHRFSASLLAPLNAIIPLAFLLLFGRKIGIVSMMYGFVCSYFIQVLLLAYTLKKELAWAFSFSPNVLTPRLKHNLTSTLIQALLNIACSWLPLYLLSGMGVGLVSALNYAKQLAETPTEILTQRVANVSKIQLTEHVAHRAWIQGNTNYLAVNHFLLFLLTPLAVFSCLYAPEIVVMFFKHGAFTLQDGIWAARFLRPLLFVMLFLGPSMLQTNVLSATRKWKDFLPYALINYLLLLIALPLTMFRWGGFAYPYTLLGCNIVGLLITYYFLRRFIPAWDGPSTLRQLGRILSVNIIALLPAAVYGWYFAGNNPWATVIIGGIIFVVTLGGLSYYSGDLQLFIRQCLPDEKR